MNKLVLSLFFPLAGCAALAGQYSVAHTGTVAFNQRVASPRIGMQAPTQYFDAPTYGVLTVANGTDEPLRLTVDCIDLTTHNVTVPPKTAQQVLVTTTVARSQEPLCAVTGSSSALVATRSSASAISR